MAASRGSLQTLSPYAAVAQGRGRDEDCSSPPAQIRTCGFPASGSCLRSNVIGIRGMGYPCSSDPWARRFGDMLVPALCPEHAVAAHPPLDRRPSLHHLRRRCHSELFEASSVLCSRPTPHPRACSSCGCCLHGPIRCVHRTRMRSPRFRAKDVSTCMGPPTARGSSSASHLRGEDVTFSSAERDRHLRIRPVSLLNTQPVVSPERFKLSG
jgi:hypothetical protein